jgi:hypothetical protein
MSDNFNLKDIKFDPNDLEKKFFMPEYYTIFKIYSITNFAYRVYCMGYNVRLEINKKYKKIRDTINFYLKNSINPPLDGPDSRGYRYISIRGKNRIKNGFEYGNVLHYNIDDAVVLIEHNSWPCDDNSLYYIVNLDSKLPNNVNNDFLGLSLNFYCKSHVGAHVVRWSGGIESIQTCSDMMKFFPYLTTINSLKDILFESRYIRNEEIIKALGHAKYIYSAYSKNFKSPNFHEDLFPTIIENKYEGLLELTKFDDINNLPNDPAYDWYNSSISFEEKFIVPLDIVIDNMDFFNNFYRLFQYPTDYIKQNLGVEMFLFPLIILRPITFKEDYYNEYVRDKYINHTELISYKNIDKFFEPVQQGGKLEYKIKYNDLIGGGERATIFGYFIYENSFDNINQIKTDDEKLYQFIVKDESTPYIFYIHVIEDFKKEIKRNNLTVIGIMSYFTKKKYDIVNNMRDLHKNFKFNSTRKRVINNYLIFSRVDGTLKHFIDLNYDYINDYLFIKKNNKKIIIYDFKKFEHPLFFVSGYLFFNNNKFRI